MISQRLQQMKLVAVAAFIAITGCDKYPTTEACLIEGDPECQGGTGGTSNGTGGNNNTGGNGSGANGTGGNGTGASGAGGSEGCIYPLANCTGTSCTNLLTDASHCGSCEIDCGFGNSCVNGQCVNGCEAEPEICDGIDNDCDGLEDEDFFVGTACLVGVGACQKIGYNTCDNNGGVECSVTPDNPTPEVCNGIDDNCDGFTDEGLNCACNPTNEICDGVDNNCDGVTDEGLPIGAACIVGTGACMKVGIYLCDGVGVSCSASPDAPSAEVCNGIDDDCNGLADEGLNCSCSATPEVCDGIDNDCDGQVDEGCPIGDQCQVGVGACTRVGIYIVDGMGGVKCSALPGAPSSEICDGIDNDCDSIADDGLSCGFIPQPELCDGVDNNLNGSTDEGFGLGSTCQVGIGACTRVGLVMCNGPAATTCSAVPGLPGTEVCNGIDDNCNGQIDEGLSCNCVAQPESCDGVDNDCDGTADELFPIGIICQVGVGACERFGFITCQLDGSADCNATPGLPGVEVCNGIDDNCDGSIDEGLSCPVCAPQGETCDGVDNDCDGTVDEGFPIGAQCTVGTGACARTGFYICDPTTGGVMCTATPGLPGVEVCNGIDDNCNGSADDGLSCGLIPEPEICDGIDNDLDGLTDEGYFVGANCLTGVGACQRLGVNVCQPNGSVACSAVPGLPTAEVCNGIDDNCDSSIDEGLACNCQPTSEVCDGVDNNCNGTADEGFPIGTTCVVGTGSCERTGVLTCDGFGGLKCSATPGLPGVESCDGIDNDCDGTADEGLSCGCAPQVEICDGTDNDCDGNTDEGFPLGAGCSVGTGACQRLGIYVCDGNGGVECSAVAGPPVAESCNGIDDDCDGSVDEGIVCPACVPDVEVCDGVDNDCDGQVDEGFALGSTCQVGVGACTRTGLTICNNAGATTCSTIPGAPLAEVCNGIDDNCNGTSDDGLSCSCVPQAEVCDGIDNDCDGQVDEGYFVGVPCTAGLGACFDIGLIACQPNGTSACNAVAGAPFGEVCNGIDDDCDGSVDEGLNCNCVPSGAEICDGIDNDCDGVADEGFNKGSTCTVGTGACQRSGVILCDGSGGQFCSATAGLPQAEVCNGVDDNCNGSADEGLSCNCVPSMEICDGHDDDCDGSVDEGFNAGGFCLAGVGACQSFGYLVCDSGGISCTAVAGVPTAESCNGIDDDCDGFIDEGLSCSCASIGAELCNGVDDNCNGTTDEGFPIGAVCSVGVGTCQQFGLLLCNGVGVSCSASAGAPTAETCNGLDDNCNGSVDEGLSCACAPTGAEVCDGIDNDCDGTTDEGFPVGSVCSVGVGGCLRFGVFQCDGFGGINCSATAGLPQAETCNGIDDDCDSIADDGLSCTCAPQAEVCDGIDNNCNGGTDEGFNTGSNCSVGIGACQRTGFIVCNGMGGTTCTAVPASPTTEICSDGIDNDCDGTIDEPACI